MRVEFLVLGPALFLFACGGEDDPDLDGTCDIVEPACQRAVFRATAKVRGQSGARMPPVLRITLQEFEESLLAAMPASGTDEADVWSQTLPLVRLLPEGSSIRDEVVDIAVAGVAAYYNSETEEVTVIDGVVPDPLDAMFVLAHEYVHSLQDASLNLGKYRGRWESSLDSSLAVLSLIEGEASVLGLGVVADALNRAPAAALNWNKMIQSMRDSAFQAIQTSRAPLFAARHSLPYPLGVRQLSSMWLWSGQTPIDELYDAPPLSVLDWAEDTNVILPTRTEALDCLPTMGPPGFAAYDHDVFGPAGLLAVGVEQGRTAEEAWASALAYRADRVVVFSQDDDPESYALAWRIRFNSETAAESFVDAASARAGANTSLTLHGREVLYYGTTQPNARAQWASDHCGTEEELPVRSSESEADSAALPPSRALERLPRGAVRPRSGHGGTSIARVFGGVARN